MTRSCPPEDAQQWSAIRSIVNKISSKKRLIRRVPKLGPHASSSLITFDIEVQLQHTSQSMTETFTMIDSWTTGSQEWGTGRVLEIPQTTAKWTTLDADFATVENRPFRPGPYLRGCMLGSGSFGKVFKVLRQSDGKVFAGKAPREFKKLRETERSFQSLRTEKNNMLRTQHKHVLRLIDLYEDPTDPLAMLLVTEFCAPGTLQTLINMFSSGLPTIDVLQAIFQIASALEFIHGKGLTHGDIKPSNILVRQKKPIDVVLADLGELRISTQLEGRAARGTKLFWPPESAATNKHAGEKGDVWALGRVMLAMAGLEPRRTGTVKDLVEYPVVCANHAKTLSELNSDHEGVDLLARLLNESSGWRATAEEGRERAGNILEDLEEVTGEGHWSTMTQMGVQMPEGFTPVTFW